MEALLEWSRGPLFVFCFTFMVLGLLRHVVLTSLDMRRILRRAGDKTLPYRQVLTATTRWLFPLSKLRNELVFSLTSIAFHVAVLVVPVFLAGHIALWSRSTGLSWPAIPNAVADVLTLCAVVTAVALVGQRLTARATRALSRPQDYALPLIVALPFATGVLAMHPSWSLLPYQTVMLAHVLSGNLVLLLLPLTKLTHAVLLPGVQLISELGWHWPADAGSKVGAALGKADHPV